MKVNGKWGTLLDLNRQRKHDSEMQCIILNWILLFLGILCRQPAKHEWCKMVATYFPIVRVGWWFFRRMSYFKTKFDWHNSYNTFILEAFFTIDLYSVRYHTCLKLSNDFISHSNYKLKSFRWSLSHSGIVGPAATSFGEPVVKILGVLQSRSTHLTKLVGWRSYMVKVFTPKKSTNASDQDLSLSFCLFSWRVGY